MNHNDRFISRISNNAGLRFYELASRLSGGLALDTVAKAAVTIKSCKLTIFFIGFQNERILNQARGKIERWHQTLKNRVLLENYYLPGALEAAIGDFIDHYNHHRYHESLGNLTPADVYLGSGLIASK